MDTNLFSLFGNEDKEEQQAPKKQTAKKKSAKGKQQTAVDLFSFDSDDTEAQEKEEPNEIVLETTENTFYLLETIVTEETPLDVTTSETDTALETIAIKIVVTAQANDHISTSEIGDNTLINYASNTGQHDAELIESGMLSKQSDNNAEELENAELATPSIAYTVQEELLKIDQQDDSEPKDAKEKTFLQTEEIPTSTESTLNSFQIEPTQELAAEVSEPTLDEFLSNLETNTDDTAASQLEKQYLQEVIVSDYSMFLEATKPSAIEEISTTLNIAETTEDVSLPEWTLTKKYYSIGEVATLFEVNTSHIRFWSKEFSFRLRTTRKGDRMYTPEDIQKLRLIHELVKVKKHTIKGAKEILNTKTQKVTHTVDLKDNLKELKNMLLGIQNKL